VEDCFVYFFSGDWVPWEVVWVLWFRLGVVVFGRSGGGWNNSWRIASAMSSAYMAFGLFGPLEMGGVG
jgi:hypothetical protein